MKADAWMPLYIADYLRKTMHLTRDQHGAYFLLIMACWDRGGRLPNDAKTLASITKSTRSEWSKLAPILLPYFEVDQEGFLTHGRVSAEHDKAQKLSEIRRQAGRLGGRPRKPVEESKKANGKANANQNGKQTILQTETPITFPFGESPIVPKGTALPEAVNRIWSKAPKISRERSSKADLKKSLEAAVKRGCDLAQIEAGLGAYFASEDATRDGGRFVKGVHRLVQGDRWSSHAPSDEGLFAEPQITEADARRLAWTKNRYWNPDWGVRPDRGVTS